MLGEDHPGTLTSLNNMAVLFEAQGHLADAEPLYREALEKCPGPQFQRDFMHSIRGRDWLNFRFISLLDFQVVASVVSLSEVF